MKTLLGFLLLTPTSKQVQRLVRQAFVCALFTSSVAALSYGQSKIEITDPILTPGAKWPSPLDLTFTTSTDIKKIRILVTAPSDNSKFEFDADKQEYSLPLLNGLNQIQVLGFKAGEKEPSATAQLTVTCSGKRCGTAGAPREGRSDERLPPPSANVTFKSPTGNVSEGPIDALMVVKGGIKNLRIAVSDEKGNPIDFQDSVDVKEADEKLGIATVKLKIGPGKNIIHIVDPAKREDKNNQTLVVVNCDGGDRCGKGASRSETVKSKLTINTSYPTPVNTPIIQPNITIAKDSGIKSIQAEVSNVSNGDKKNTTTKAFTVAYADDKTGTVTPTIKILNGENTIRFFDPDDRENVNQASLKVICSPGCGTDFGNIKILQPSKDYKALDEPSVSSRIIVQKDSNIQKLLIRVTDSQGNTVDDDSNKQPITLDFTPGEQSTELSRQIRIVEGTNRIAVLDYDHQNNEENQAFVQIVCRGSKCGFLDEPGSQNVRMVAGFEQSGASSAESQTKPFLDLFFNTPLRFSGGNRIPVISAWGQIRLATTPEQTGAVGVFPSNLIDRVTQTGQTVDLVQSFDYQAGLEFRLFKGNGEYPGLGSNRRAHFFLAGGGGAISPLSSKKESIEIFKVPAVGTLQRDLFIQRFGDVAATKGNIAFVLPERDRFLRQFYGGIRLKVFECDKPGESLDVAKAGSLPKQNNTNGGKPGDVAEGTNDGSSASGRPYACTRFANRFPAMFDFMVGQNEAVTGGKLMNDVTDSTGKIIGQKRSWVLRFDGFFPLSVKGAGLYLYGTAIMKIGGGGVRVTTPLFLDRSDGAILVTNPDVFIAPNLQLDRDYYKIGVGFDLMRLFSRQPTSPR